LSPLLLPHCCQRKAYEAHLIGLVVYLLHPNNQICPWYFWRPREKEAAVWREEEELVREEVGTVGQKRGAADRSMLLPRR
jgi:hypothetical protein